MQTITAGLTANNRFSRRRRVLFALGATVYLIALYSLLTSFYIFEIRRSGIQTGAPQLTGVSVDQKTIENREFAVRLALGD